jgi:hypothetical protein
MITVNKANPTPGEITSSLTGSTGDGAGLHFDGSGSIDIASPPDLGDKLSFEFVTSVDDGTASQFGYLVDFGGGSGRMIFGSSATINGNLGVYYNSAWGDFGVKVLDDEQVHHLCVTIDGTSATLFDNGNQVATATIGALNIDGCTDAKIGTNFVATGAFFTGTIYRTRFYNKALTSAEVRTAYQRADVPFADQHGSQTIVIPGDFDGDLDGWDSGNTWNSQTNPSNNMVLAASNTNQYCRTAVTLTKGFKYRVTYTASSLTGSPFFAYAQGGSIAAIPATSGSTTITAGTKSAEFTLPDDANPTYFYIASGTSSDSVTLDNVSVVRIGCVSDYDLAFASPTQSLTVQDRSGAADGTCSASGVTQVQPVVQLNSTSARIGTSAATPADGELSVSGELKTGSGSSAPSSSSPYTYLNGLRISGGDASNTIYNAHGNIGLTTPNGGLSISSSTGNATFSKDIIVDSGTTDVTATFKSSDARAWVQFRDDSTTDTAVMVGAEGDDLKLRAGSNTRVTIDSSGNALFNTTVTNPGNGNTNTGASILATGRMHLSSAFDHTVNRSSDGNVFEFRRSNTAVGSIAVTTSATAFNTSSDYRLKENLTPLTGALDRLDALPVYRFNFKSDPDTTVDGFVAHEVQAHVPEAVTGEKDAMKTVEIPAVLDDDGNEVEAARTEEQPDYQGIDQSKLVPLLVAAVKELKAKVETLENA